MKERQRQRGRDQILESELSTRSHELGDGWVSMYWIMPAWTELTVSDSEIKPEFGGEMILLSSAEKDLEVKYIHTQGRI